MTTPLQIYMDESGLELLDTMGPRAPLDEVPCGAHCDPRFDAEPRRRSIAEGLRNDRGPVKISAGASTTIWRRASLRKKQLRPIESGAGRDRVYVDTSAWIAFFSAHNQNHAEAKRLFREAVSRNVLLTTTNLVLAEVHRLILHRVGVAAAALALERIVSSTKTSVVFASAEHHARRYGMACQVHRAPHHLH